jgi:hypothetical protein
MSAFDQIETSRQRRSNNDIAKFNVTITSSKGITNLSSSSRRKDTKLRNKTSICAYTGAIRTSIPALSGHPFRFNPDTDSGISQPVFC